MSSHAYDLPPTLSTGYDLLPLPSLEQFESDRNLPVPTRRITVDELVKVVHEEGDESDVEAGVRKVGKVRAYGRVVQYLESEGVLIIDDPDTPRMTSSSLSLPRTSSSRSNSRPRRANALAKIGITTSILSSHLHAASSSSSPYSSYPSKGNSTDRTSTQNLPRDLDAAHEYALGRYPAGSGQIQVGQITGKTPMKNSSGEEKGERVLRPVNLEPGRAVCVVGYLELFIPSYVEDKDATHRKGQSEDVDNDEEESASDRQRRRAWDEVKARGWVVNALQIMNVPVYEHVAHEGGSSFNLDTLGSKEVNGRKGQMEVNTEAYWGRRSGLERYD